MQEYSKALMRKEPAAEQTARYWVIPTETALQSFRGLYMPFLRLLLIPDNQNYAIGDTAVIQVR